MRRRNHFSQDTSIASGNERYSHPITSSPSKHAVPSGKFLPSVLRLLLPLSRSDIAVTVAIPIVIVLYLVGGYWLVLVPGDVYQRVVDEEVQAFSMIMVRYGLLATIMVTLKVARGLLRETLENMFRKKLGRRLHKQYLRSGGFYWLKHDNEIDNPDQRVVEDTVRVAKGAAEVFCGASEGFGDSGGAVEALMSIIWYSIKTLERTGWTGMIVAYMWSGMTTLVMAAAIRAIVPWEKKQETLEANLRYSHAGLRMHAEEVMFLRGSAFEQGKLDKELDDAVINKWTVAKRRARLNSVRHGFSYFVTLLMYGTIGISVFTGVARSTTSYPGHGDAGEKAKWVSQTAGVFLQLLYSFTMLVELCTTISTLVASSSRLEKLVIRLKRGKDSSDHKTNPSKGAGSEPDSATKIAVQELLFSIDGVAKRTVGPISFSVTDKHWVAIQGRAGSGKTSILRVLRGLWTKDQGLVRIPKECEDVMFLPQHPYLGPSRSLREILCYPRAPLYSEAETEACLIAFNAVGYKILKGKEELDRVCNWSELLSPGEAQMVAVARVLKHCPRIAIMDEPVSAMDEISQSKVMDALKTSGMGVLVVQHRAASKKGSYTSIIDLDEK